MNTLNKNEIENTKSKRSKIIGLSLIFFGFVIYLFFGLGIEGQATFRLSRPTDPFALPNLILPAHSFIGLSALLIAFFGGRIIMKAPKNFTIFVALSFFLAIAAFLVWATAGKSLSLTGMLQATVVRAVPIALAAMAGIMCERVAVINIGIEGMLLAGAFAGALFGSIFGNLIGLILAILVGGGFGFILAALVVTFRVDQIIAGVAINIFVLGITSFLTSHLLKNKVDRNDTLIALGGGVIGDLVGFVASITLRGINFIQMPTSLLAMVDSAVGGKTGVNLDEGKNLVGAFHQPKLVLSDLKTLKSLPNREFIAGMAEVIKYGIIYDEIFFNRIEASLNEINTNEVNSSLLAEIIGRCCEIKAEIVSKDEKENALRAILNFGHTVGHAIENKTGYSSSLIHGEAISIGMVFAAEVSSACLNLSNENVTRIKNILSKVGLPISNKSLGWMELKEVINIVRNHSRKI